MAKKPGLRARSAAAQAAMSVADTAAAPAGKPRATTVRLDTERYEQLRTLGFNARRSQHSLLLEGVDLLLKKYGTG